MRALLLLLLLLSLPTLGQICPPDSFAFADAIDAPKFRDAPIAPRDQPAGSTAGFLPQDGVDAGEYVELTQLGAYRYRITANREFYVTPRDVDAEGYLDYTGAPGGLPIHRIYLVPPDCGADAARNNSAYDGLRITCENCPELPHRPAAATVDEYLVDSFSFYRVPEFNFSNYLGEGSTWVEMLSPAEQRAWSSLNPTGTLMRVQRSKPLSYSAPPGTETLYVDLSEVEFNTDYYELTGLADGIGVSLVGLMRAEQRAVVLDADYTQFASLQTDRRLRLTLDLTKQSSGFDDYAVMVWRVAAVRETNGPAIGTFSYPGNYIRFGFSLATPLPPPPPPPHDDCAAAREIPYHPTDTISPGLVDSIYLAGATLSGPNQTCGNGGDVWLSFMAGSEQHKFLAVDSDSTQLIQAFHLYRGDCAAPVFLKCFTPIRGIDDYTLLEDLTVGERYYIRLLGQTSFDEARNYVRYALFGAEGGCTRIRAALTGTECVDAVYYLANLEITDLGGQPEVYVRNDAGDTLLTVTSPGTYAVRTYPSALSIIGANRDCDGPVFPARQENCDNNQNDECRGAFDLPVSPASDPLFAVGSTTLPAVSASDSLAGPIPAECGGTAGAVDVWFVATNPGTEPADLGFTLRDALTGETTYATYFYSGTCDGLTYLTCSRSGYVEIPDVPPGGKIYLRSARISSRFANFHTSVRIALHVLAAPTLVDCDVLTGEMTEGGNILRWTLNAPPVGLSGWIIQRGTNTTDWETVLTLGAEEGTADGLTYEAFVPGDGVTGLIVFRLLGVGEGGQTQQVCNLINNVTDPELEAGLFPNPVTSGQLLHVNLPGAGSRKGKAELIDPMGRVVATRTERHADVWELSVPAALPPGVYLLRLTVGHRHGVRRVVVR